MNGEIFFNMFKEPHPSYGKSEFLLKRWQRHTIYAQSGSYVRSTNPSEIRIHSSSVRRMTATSDYVIPDSPKANVYSTNSIYLYDYVVVSDKFFLTSVYTASSIDSTPTAISNHVGGSQWYHEANTWLNSPNTIFNNYLLPYNPLASAPGARNYPVYGYDPLYPGTPVYAQLMQTPIYRDDGTYFEIVRGYPRNHYIHKRGYFALERFMSYGLANRTVTSASYRKGMQTNGTTIGPTGLSDGSDPVQSTQVTNIDLIKSDNVIYH
jgi:hypothetical protein